MPSTATCASASTPEALTPSQSVVVPLHTATSAPSTPSPTSYHGSGSFVPIQRFECVRVAKKLRRNSRHVYVAGVFLQRSEARRRLSAYAYRASPASKLSPEAMRTVMMAEREPNFVVERRFSEFRRLRDNVAALVRADGAHVKACAECQDLLQVVRSPNFQNWTVKRMFRSKEQRFALLTTFVNDLLTLTTSASERTSTTEEIDCSVRERVAQLLQEFLKRKYRASLGII
ncbi:hypothetical protein PHMEG_0002366 [Phytophthora megakarya]|uniref:PX domain-containing protein n=1 Tax=Phytophthora megakarya TaxID=4795 RepID=A0A225WYG0_9STRA|nr:hypothetical protein PHMEG_0002366 [Phytophthora megakarya]